MPELRTGVRRGRPPKHTKKEQQVQTDIDLNRVGEGEGIATRTRRRRAAAAAAAAAEPVVNENVAVAPQPVQPVEPVVEAREPAGREKQEVAGKAMDVLNGGKSGAKDNAGDDDGVNAPVPDTVIFDYIHFNCLCMICYKYFY